MTSSGAEVEVFCLVDVEMEGRLDDGCPILGGDRRELVGHDELRARCVEFHRGETTFVDDRIVGGIVCSRRCCGAEEGKHVEGVEWIEVKYM